VCSEHFSELFSDPEAERICDSLDYDFADKRKRMESAAGLFGVQDGRGEKAVPGKGKDKLRLTELTQIDIIQKRNINP